jgi:hypothetical protein
LPIAVSILRLSQFAINMARNTATKNSQICAQARNGIENQGGNQQFSPQHRIQPAASSSAASMRNQSRGKHNMERK